MKLANEVGSVKLRGAFYTSPSLVERCYANIASLINPRAGVRILEPSAGEGAFVRGLVSSPERFQRPHITCIEVEASEAAKCRQEIISSNISGVAINDSFFNWASQNQSFYDAIVGNPPFIRYQFVPEQDRFWAEWLLKCSGYELDGVSNIWIPFVLLSLGFLREGGAFAFVLPSELLATISGAQVRTDLIHHAHSLRIELFPRNSFPDILQDIVIVSGVRTKQRASQRIVTFCEFTAHGEREWQHQIPADNNSWTRFLLSEAEWVAYSCAKSLPGFYRLDTVACIGVSIVTGANDFFTVDDKTAENFDLSAWTLPLLARTAESPGLIFTQADHIRTRQQGKKAWLLDFSSEKPEPQGFVEALRYLNMGVTNNLHTRYKCRIRSPWYRVPQIQKGALMMAKRAHHHHRLLLNLAGAYTTDTIYRGKMKPDFAGLESRLVTGFHNSVTLLSAELEGRTYGGGVLELVPSEISRLTVPMVDTGDFLKQLDVLSRDTGGQKDANDRLAEATDAILCGLMPPLKELLPAIISARIRLRNRRFNGHSED